MGTTYLHGASRREAIREALGDWENPKTGASCRTVRRCFRGNTCYSVHRHATREGEISVFAVVTLLSRCAGVGWGYKQFDEDSGPYYWGFPWSWVSELDPPVQSGRIHGGPGCGPITSGG